MPVVYFTEHVNQKWTSNVCIITIIIIAIQNIFFKKSEGVLEFNSLHRTADIKVHVIHMSHVIIPLINLPSHEHLGRNERMKMTLSYFIGSHSCGL